MRKHEGGRVTADSLDDITAHIRNEFVGPRAHAPRRTAKERDAYVSGYVAATQDVVDLLERTVIVKDVAP